MLTQQKSRTAVHAASEYMGACFFTGIAVLLLCTCVKDCETRTNSNFTHSLMPRLSGGTFDSRRLSAEASRKSLEQSQYLAICVIVKNQHADMKEWLTYHEMMGVSQFYVFDDQSTPLMNDSLQGYIDNRLVTYHVVDATMRYNGPYRQLSVYDRCLTDYGSKHVFMGFIDVDEFLFLRDPNVQSIPELLHDYEAYGGLGVNWVLFGTSGHSSRPSGNTMANYWRCAPAEHKHNLHIKTIANTQYANWAEGPHKFLYRDNKQAVDEAFVPINGSLTSIHQISRIALYHYILKSKEEFEEKMLRGTGMGNKKGRIFFDELEREVTENCTDALLWSREHMV